MQTKSNSKKGKFIVLDGIDGSGKATQTQKLVEFLKSEGYKIAQFDFPQYSKPSAYFVEKYLNGRYGKFLKVGPYKASLFYALDRFDVRDKMEKALREGKIVLSNRYVAANMGHQGSRISDSKVRAEFFYWVQHLEYDIFEIPRPDLNILLHLPAKLAQKLVDKKQKRAYLTKGKRDLHEASRTHLSRAERTYREIARFDPQHFVLINCMKNGSLMSIDEVHAKVKEKVLSVLR